jgi:hypothetical protein
MPLGIGYIAATVSGRFEGALDLRLFESPDLLIEAIEDWRTDVIGLSNYAWNANLNQRILALAADRLPGVIRVGGGPEIPMDRDGITEHLGIFREFDFYCLLGGKRHSPA